MCVSCSKHHSFQCMRCVKFLEESSVFLPFVFLLSLYFYSLLPTPSALFSPCLCPSYFSPLFLSPYSLLASTPSLLSVLRVSHVVTLKKPLWKCFPVWGTGWRTETKSSPCFGVPYVRKTVVRCLASSCPFYSLTSVIPTALCFMLFLMLAYH